MVSALEKDNRVIESLSVIDRIAWAHARFDDRLILTTSFGTYSAVMLHLVANHAPTVPVISIDTGHNAETRAFADALVERLSLRISRHTLPPPPPRDPAHPPVLIEDYLKQAKVETLEAALREHRALAWMSGVQRNETDHRRDFDFLMRRADGLYKFHPLLDWDSRRLFAYCKEHGLPVNDHYVDPAKGSDQKQECGIHLTGMANESFTSSEL